MTITNLDSLCSQINVNDIWEEIIDDTVELYLDKGGEYHIRIIGPVIKARRCYIGRNNNIVRQMQQESFRKMLNGNPVSVNELKFSEQEKNEVYIAANRAKWSPCLITTVILLSSNRDLKNGELYYCVIPKLAVRCIIESLQTNKECCLSGVEAHNIILRKDNSRFSHVLALLDSKSTFLPKGCIKMLLERGLKDPMEFYTDMNKSNTQKRYGFFYSFKDREKSSVLDRHMEPIKQIGNYFEEDKQYKKIQSDPKLMAEFEGVNLIEFNDIR